MNLPGTSSVKGQMLSSSVLMVAKDPIQSSSPIIGSLNKRLVVMAVAVVVVVMVAILH